MDKSKEIECEPEYEEIPASRTGLHVVNPIFSNREDHTPFSPTSVDYEEVSMQRRENPRSPREQYENVDLEDPSEYNRLEHSVSMKKSSTSSVPDSHKPLQTKTFTMEEGVFDDSKYTPVDPCPSRSHMQIHTAPQEGGNLEMVETSESKDPPEYSTLEYSVKKISTSSTPGSGVPPHTKNTTREESRGVFDDPKYTPVDRFLPRDHMPVHLSKSAPKEENEYSYKNRSLGNKSNRKLSYDSSTGGSHTYTPVLPKQARGEGDLTDSIVSTEDRYISEQGHIYHILESSTKSES